MKNFYLISVVLFALAFFFWLAEVDTVPMVLCIIGGVLFVVRYFHDYAKDPKPLKRKPKAQKRLKRYAATTWWYMENNSSDSDCGYYGDYSSSSDCGDCSAS